MQNQPETTIRERQTRTERTFIDHTGSWNSALAAYQAGVRVWLDVGDHKQAIRTMSPSTDEEGNRLVIFTMRDEDGKHVAYSNLAHEDIFWYEEEFR